MPTALCMNEGDCGVSDGANVCVEDTIGGRVSIVDGNSGGRYSGVGCKVLTLVR